MSTTEMRSRLTAILAADAVGYSRLMALDDSATVLALDAAREIFRKHVFASGGRVVDTAGDSVLAIFDTAAGAVRTAISIQHDLTFSAGRDHLAFRIGLHLGDVIEKSDGSVYGDGINVASRLQALAEPGGITLSDSIYQIVKNKLHEKFESLGEHALKNVSEKFFIHRMLPAEFDLSRKFSHRGFLTKELEEGSVHQLPDSPSIAVLPFTNMSGDVDQDYFADGLVEDIITALCCFKSLFVIARNSSFTYKGKAMDVRQIGRELGVRYVLEGSVRKSVKRVRITGQLIDALTGAHLWAERFDGDLDDIFNLQDEITAKVVGVIEPTVQQAEILRARRSSKVKHDSYDYLMQGMGRFHLSTKQSIEDAIVLYSKAIELDANFAAPYAWSTVAYSRKKQAGWMLDPAIETAEGVRLARKAIDLGNGDALALAGGGFGLAWLAGDLDAGLTWTDRALALNPNFANAWHGSGWIRCYVGEPETAILHLSNARRLSPLDYQMHQFIMATSIACRYAGRYNEAVSWAEKTLQITPGYEAANVSYAITCALAGHISTAKAALEKALKANPKIRISNLSILTVLRRDVDREATIRGARLAGMED